MISSQFFLGTTLKFLKFSIFSILWTVQVLKQCDKASYDREKKSKMLKVWQFYKLLMWQIFISSHLGPPIILYYLFINNH